MLLHILLDCKEVSDGICAAVSNDHRLTLATNLEATVVEEVSHNHFGLIVNGMTVFLIVLNQSSQRRPLNQLGVVLRHLNELERLLDGGVVGKHVEYVALLNRLTHRIDVERTHFLCRGLYCAKELNGLILGSSSERKEGLVRMHTLRKDRADDIRGEIHLRLIDAFFLCIELNCLINVEQGFTQGLCAFSRLTLMCLVNDNRILSAHELVEVLVCKEELLNGADNDTLLIVDGIDKTARTLLVVDRLNQTGSVVEAVYGIL